MECFLLGSGTRQCKKEKPYESERKKEMSIFANNIDISREKLTASTPTPPELRECSRGAG